MKKYYFLIILFFLVIGCDIPGKLVIENRSAKDATYRCEFFEKDSIYEVIVKPAKGENTAGLFFGFGNLWTDARVKEYVSSIKKIQIISITDTTVLLNSEEMYSFFKKRRKGLLKDEIKIGIR